MFAGLTAWIVGRLWRSARVARAVVRVTGRPPAGWLMRPKVCWCAGVLAAFGYAALSGWGIPAQRTCWMLLGAGLANLSGRSRAIGPVLTVAMLVIITVDPWAPLSAGFWLSFGAVAAIVLVGQRRLADHRRRRWWREAIRAQWAVTVLMVPLGAWFFATTSWIGPLANAVAIPLVSLLITPLALLGAAVLVLLPWPMFGGGVLQLAGWLSGVMLDGLVWLEPAAGGHWVLGTPGMPVLLLAMVACALLLAPWTIRHRWLLLLALAPVGMRPVERPAGDEWWIQAIDVGQGMAVLIEGRDFRVLYDAGPKYSEDADAGSRFIVPWLRARGIERLDAVVVSHADSDHAGGVASVLRAIQVDQVYSSLPTDHPIVQAATRHHRCQRGGGWNWGSTRFDWLHPDGTAPADAERRKPSENSRSCVLRIAGPAGVVLLPGDLEAPQERVLLAQLPRDQLAADLLFAPHHGSTSSSTDAFVRAVHPRVVVFQVGYLNRFHHPRPVVVERYRRACSQLLRSDAHGAISIRMTPGQRPWLGLARVDQPRYWRVEAEAERVDAATTAPSCAHESTPAPTLSGDTRVAAPAATAPATASIAAKP